MLKRHAIQFLREAGHKQAVIAKQLGVSERSVRTDLHDQQSRSGLGAASSATRTSPKPSSAPPSEHATCLLTSPPLRRHKTNRQEFPERHRRRFRNPQHRTMTAC